MEQNKIFLQQINATKKILRTSMRILKEEISQDEKNKASEKVFQLLESCPEFQAAQSVLIYWSLPDELPTHQFIEKWSKSKQILLPRVEGNDLIITKYSTSNDLKIGELGIMEPPHTAIYRGETELAVIPGIAFDKEGNRLGRGKGYYDRFLAGKKCLTVGVGFGFQLVEALPVSNEDVKMQIIITPSNLLRCHQNQ